MTFYVEPEPGDDAQAPALQIHLLGATDFDACLTLQRRLAFELGEQRDGRAHVLICEHPPLITVGRQGSWADVLCDPRELISRQLSVRWVSRGGGCVVHGPGQLAVYPLIPLDVHRWGLAEYRRRLERCLIEIADECGVRAERAPHGEALAGKHGQFAFMGIAVKNWITQHGFYLNVAPDLFLQRLVRPYHPASNGEVRMSSLANERTRPLRMDAVREAVARFLVHHLGFARSYVFAGHPLLRSARHPHAVPTPTR